MSRFAAVLLAAAAGGLVGMQAPVNSRLGKSVGSFEAATFSFLVGTLALVLILLIARGGIGGFGHIGRVPWWGFVGGLLGVAKQGIDAGRIVGIVLLVAGVALVVRR